MNSRGWTSNEQVTREQRPNTPSVGGGVNLQQMLLEARVLLGGQKWNQFWVSTRTDRAEWPGQANRATINTTLSTMDINVVSVGLTYSLSSLFCSIVLPLTSG